MTIGRKFALWITSILLVVSTAASYLLYSAKLKEEAHELDMFGRMAGSVIEESLFGFMQRRDMTALGKEMENIRERVGNISGIMLLNSEAVAKVGTDPALIGRKYSIHEEGCRECHEQGYDLPLIYGGRTYRWASPVRNRPECHICHLASVKYNGVLVIDFFTNEFRHNIKREILTAYGIFSFSLIAIGIVMVLLTKVMVTRRVERLGESMRDFQQGGSPTPSVIEGHDEITQLQTGFNEMADAITSREREKDETNETLQAVIHASPLAVVSFDSNGNVGMWNTAAERIFGWSEEEVVGQYNPLVSVENKQEFIELLRRVLGGDSLMGVELRRKRKDGMPIDVSVSSAPLRDAKNDIVGILSVIGDVTERKKAEEMLELLKRSIDVSSDAAFWFDSTGTFVYVNDAACKSVGYDRNELMKMHLSDINPGADREHWTGLWERLRAQKTIHAEATHKRKDGVLFPVEIISTYIRFGEREYICGFARDITERKHAEEKIRASEKKYRDLFETATDAIFVLDLEGNFIDANTTAYTRLGYTKEEMLTMHVSKLDPPEFAARVPERLAQIKEHGTAVFETAHIRKDGSVMPVEVNSRLVEYEGRQVYFSILRDITERKRAEQVIRRNYDAQTAINWILHISLEDLLLDGILKQTLDLILSISWLSLESRGSIFLVEEDPNKLVMKAQRGLSEFLNEECKIVPFGKCLCGMAAARGEVQFAETLDDRHEVSYDGITPHGHYCVPIMYAKKVVGVINLYLKEGHQRDQKEIDFLNAIADALAGIIQRKRVEEEREKLIDDLRHALDTVSRSHKEWQDTFDSITDMISIVDKDFTILKTNTAFSKYYGFQPQDVVGKKCYEIVHDGFALPNCPHISTMAEKTPSGEEFLDQRTKKLFHVVTFPYNSPEGEAIGSIHIMRDITDDKEKEMRLIMSERLATLGQMASGIAHEINNPLASIAGCSEGLLARVKKRQCDMALFESYLGIIQEEVFRCKSITTAMLSFVRKTTYEKKDINLTEALDKTIEIIGFQGRLKNIEIVRRYHEPSPVIHGNEGELRQVILIMITNALDAMQDKGRLTIETESLEGRAVIRISDTGEGMSPEIINRIFDPFFTTKTERGGTGLGLSIARKIVGNHNGNIEVASTSGQGTTFSITFPL